MNILQQEHFYAGHTYFLYLVSKRVFVKSLLPWREKVRMRGESRADTFIFTLTSVLSRRGRGGYETFENTL